MAPKNHPLLPAMPLLAALLGLMVLPGCPASTVTTITLNNNSACAITELYLAEAGAADLGSNLLDRPISSGESAVFSDIPNGRYTLRILDNCGNETLRQDLELSGADRSFTYVDPTEGEAGGEGEDQEGEGVAEGEGAAEAEGEGEGEIQVVLPDIVGFWTGSKDLGEDGVRDFTFTFESGGRVNHVCYAGGEPQSYSGAYVWTPLASASYPATGSLTLDFDTGANPNDLDTVAVVLFTSADSWRFTVAEPCGGPITEYTR